MSRKILLGIALAAASIAVAPMLIGVGSAQQANASYDFEECEQGWTAESGGSNPLSAGWTWSAPGDNSEFAWHIEGATGGAEDEFLVSPVHTASGSAVNITYRIAHDVFDDETLERVDLEWSSDGAEWTVVEGNTFTGTNEGNPEYVDASGTFTPPAGDVQVRYRFFIDGPAIAGGATASVDNVEMNLPMPDTATCPSPSAEPSASTSGSPDPSGSPSPSPSGSPTTPPDDNCTIRGTEDGERLVGTGGDDIICGYGGNDTIIGRGGNDRLLGGKGADEIKGGPGDDVLRGGPGKDLLRGGRGNDKHFGGGGTDTCKDDQGRNRFNSCEKR